MKRLTLSDIKHQLLAGSDVQWKDASGKAQRLRLSEANQRRLFAFLLSSDVRMPTGLSSDFIAGLSIAYEGSEDPAVAVDRPFSGASGARTWRLHMIETEGFGGLNSWDGGSFRFVFNGEGLLLEGPNGSGKSSLVSAIVWALSGQRPRDQADARADMPCPVFASNDNKVGVWPPIATYPPSVADLQGPPRVLVRLTFKDTGGATASVERLLHGESMTSTIDPALAVPSVFLETGLLMPARLGRLRLDDERGRLTNAVQKLTGLDDLIAIGTLTEGLCHKSREYRAHRRKDLISTRENFSKALGKARDSLAPVHQSVHSFVPEDTSDNKGQMAMFGQMLNDRAAELAQVISADLAEELNLSSLKVQHKVIASIAKARDEVRIGLERSATWRLLLSIERAFDRETSEHVRSVIADAHANTKEAVRLFKREKMTRSFG